MILLDFLGSHRAESGMSAQEAAFFFCSLISHAERLLVMLSGDECDIPGDLLRLFRHGGRAVFGPADS